MISLDTPALIVQFGFGGNLSKSKLIAAYWQLYKKYQQAGMIFPMEVIGSDLRPLKDSGDKTITLDEYIRTFARPSMPNPRNINAFIRKFTFVQTPQSDTESENRLVEAIQKKLEEHPNRRICFYLAVPYEANIELTHFIARLIKQKVVPAEQVYVYYEKPAAVRAEEVKQLRDIMFDAGIREDCLNVVEHWAQKVGVKQFPWQAFGIYRNNQFLRAGNISSVIMTVTEEIGSDGRAYPGVIVDSLLNHVAYTLGLILNNPIENGVFNGRMKVPDGLRRLIYSPADYLPEEEREIARQDFQRQLRPFGVYAMCEEDHCDPKHTPTGVMLQFRPNNNRWRGQVPFTIIHCKNSSTKRNDVSFITVKGDNARGAMYRYHFESIIDSQRYWGWEELEGDQRYDKRQPVPEGETDGYPQMLEAMAANQAERFTTLEFQRLSSQLFMPWADVLDRSPLEDRIRFHKGQYPFKNPECSKKLIPLFE